MNFSVKYSLLFLYLSIFRMGYGENADTRQRCVSPDFRSLQVLVNDRNDLPAVVIAGSNDRLTVSFDELSTEKRNLRWRLTHCNARWEREDISDFEFTESLNEATVDNYEYSQATLTHYVHYTITVLDSRIPIKLSGNYLLTVYEEYSPDQPLIQVRFSVADNNMKIDASVSGRTDIDYLEKHQQLEITVDTEGAGIRNPYTDIITVVKQNPTDQNFIALPSPSMIKGTTLVYTHQRPLIFKGCNEYRRFETVSTSYPGKGVDRIYHIPEGYFADLMIDNPRYKSGYAYDATQHGGFIIRGYDSDNSDTESEYIITNFRFESPKLPLEVHIDGALTANALDSSSQMHYNVDSGCYEKTLVLKQGAYDYRYVTRNPLTGEVSTDYTEGNFCDTTNRYTIYVYYRLPGERFDRLGAVTTTQLHK